MKCLKSKITRKNILKEKELKEGNGETAIDTDEMVGNPANTFSKQAGEKI